MLDQILKAVSGEVGESLMAKAGLSKDQAEKAISLTGESTMEVVTSKLGSGDLSSIMNLFSSKPNNSGANLIQDQITSVLSKKLADQLGMSKQSVSMVVSMVLPAVMNYISNKNDQTPDDDSSPIQEIFGNAAAKAVTGKLGGFMKKLF